MPARRRRLGGGGDQFARELPDQALQRPEIAGDLLPLRSRLALEIGAHGVDLGMHLVEFVADLIGPAKAADRRGRGIFAERLVETLDAVGEQIEPGDVVLDPIDALQVLVDDFERRLDLVQPVGGGGGAGAAREHQIGRRHHQIERGGGDQRGDLGDAGLDDESHREGQGRHRHGDQHDHVEHGQSSRGIASPRGHGNSVRHVRIP